MTDWDPALYNRFRAYRAEPFEMILGRLRLRGGERIADLGCGSGENSIELARRSGMGSAHGIDSSPAMIERAAALRAALAPDLRARVSFTLGDFRDFTVEREYEVVCSNAALQWVSGHRAVLARWYRALRPGGALVVQMPANEHETAQATIHVLAHEQPWAAQLAAIETPSRQTVGHPEGYRTMLAELGFGEIDCHYHTFRHPMASPAEVIEWCRATALRPYLERLRAARHGEFIAALTQRLERAYGTRGPLVFNFQRLFLWARRPAQ